MGIGYESPAAYQKPNQIWVPPSTPHKLHGHLYQMITHLWGGEAVAGRHSFTGKELFKPVSPSSWLHYFPPSYMYQISNLKYLYKAFRGKSGQNLCETLTLVLLRGGVVAKGDCNNPPNSFRPGAQNRAAKG